MRKSCHRPKPGDAFRRQPLPVDFSEGTVALHIIQRLQPFADHRPGCAFGDGNIGIDIFKRQDQFDLIGVDIDLPGNLAYSQVAVEPQVHASGEQFF